MTPLSGDELTKLHFVDVTVGMNIPKQFIPAIEKGFLEACEKGRWNVFVSCGHHSVCVHKIYLCISKLYIQYLYNLGFITGHKIVGVAMTLEDGVAHAVDSSELAFKLAARGAVRTFFPQVIS